MNVAHIGRAMPLDEETVTPNGDWNSRLGVSCSVLLDRSHCSGRQQWNA